MFKMTHRRIETLYLETLKRCYIATYGDVLGGGKFVSKYSIFREKMCDFVG